VFQLPDDPHRHLQHLPQLWFEFRGLFMTLRTICTNVALDLGVAVPLPPIYGSSVPAAQRLFAQARRAAQALHRRANWSALVVEHTFTATGSSDFALPDDFAWLVADTVWERSRYWQMRGAMSAQEWQRYKSSIYGRSTIWRRWRVRLPSGASAGAPTTFSIDPPVSGVDTTSKFVFEYVSKNWCVSLPPGGLPEMTDEWTGDSDQAVLDEWLIELGTRWRTAHRLGLAYDEEKDEAEREEDKAIARDAGTAILNLVPSSRRDDFIGQYTLGAFPPASPPPPAPVTLIGPPRPIRLLAAPPGPLPVTQRAAAPVPAAGRVLNAPPPPPARVPAGVLRVLQPRRPRLYQPPMSDE
jgi:hypothetical protein